MKLREEIEIKASKLVIINNNQLLAFVGDVCDFPATFDLSRTE